MTHFCDVYCRLRKIVSEMCAVLSGNSIGRAPSMIGMHNSDVRRIKLKSVSVQVIVPQIAKTKTQRKVSKS
jgi:hypothetical protein